MVLIGTVQLEDALFGSSPLPFQQFEDRMRLVNPQNTERKNKANKQFQRNVEYQLPQHTYWNYQKKKRKSSTKKYQ